MTFQQFSLFDLSGAATAEATAPVNPVPAWIAPSMGDDGEAFGLPLSAWVEFDEWLHTPAGGEIANRFLRLAVRMHRRGWDHYSAQGIIEQMRWEHDLAHGPDVGGFKINHNWRRRLTLWAMVRCPELDGFFRVREHEQEDAALVAEPTTSLARSCVDGVQGGSCGVPGVSVCLGGAAEGRNMEV